MATDISGWCHHLLPYGLFHLLCLCLPFFDILFIAPFSAHLQLLFLYDLVLPLSSKDSNQKRKPLSFLLRFWTSVASHFVCTHCRIDNIIMIIFFYHYQEWPFFFLFCVCLFPSLLFAITDLITFWVLLSCHPSRLFLLVLFLFSSVFNSTYTVCMSWKVPRWRCPKRGVALSTCWETALLS